MRAMKRVFALMFVFLAGCGPKEVTKFVDNPPPAQLAENWRTLPMEDIGATINAPTDWRTPGEQNNVIDMSNMGGEGSVTMSDEQMKNDLKLPDEMIKQQHESEKLPTGVSLILYKRGIIGETSTITQIQVGHKKVEGGTTVKAAADEMASKYMGSGKRSTVQLPIGPAELITITTKTRDGESGHHIHYVMVNNEDVYILTLQTEQQKNVIEDIAQPIAESFRLKK